MELRAIRARSGIRLQPAGAYAAKLLGLSEQVPAKINKAVGNDCFLNLSGGDWRDALTEAALGKGIPPIILEKDFRVCRILRLIFSDSEFGARVVFKGGTSLSKAYGVIDRFSEDVDLGIDPGFVGLPKNLFDSLTSRTSRDLALAKMQVECGAAMQRLNSRLEARIPVGAGSDFRE